MQVLKRIAEVKTSAIRASQHSSKNSFDKSYSHTLSGGSAGASEVCHAARREAVGQIFKNLLQSIKRRSLHSGDGVLGEMPPDLLQTRDEGATLLSELDDGGPGILGGGPAADQPLRFQLANRKRDVGRLALKGSGELDLRACPVCVKLQKKLSLVAITSVVGAIAAAIIFAVIGLFARRPVRLFRIVSVVALVLSFAMPLTIPGAPFAMVLSLEVMHVVAWAVIVWLLTTLARKAKPASA